MTGLTEVLPDIWRWSWFSEEKGMSSNSYCLKLPSGIALIDPVYAVEETWAALEALGKPSKIFLTNRDHERTSDELRRRFKVPVSAHEAEASLLLVKPEETFKDGAILMGSLKVVRFAHLKTPGECAFYWQQRKALFVGDAVRGYPAGTLSLIKKHSGRPEVLDDLKLMLGLDFDALFVGNGEPFLEKGKPAFQQFLTSLQPLPAR